MKSTKMPLKLDKSRLDLSIISKKGVDESGTH
jgi:hypothetical protein